MTNGFSGIPLPVFYSQDGKPHVCQIVKEGYTNDGSPYRVSGPPRQEVESRRPYRPYYHRGPVSPRHTRVVVMIVETWE